MMRPADSREVNGADGRPVCGPLRLLFMLEERSRRFGRGREDAGAGEPGSRLTLIGGGGPERDVAFCGLLLFDACRSVTYSGEALILARLAAGSWSCEDEEGEEVGAMEAYCRGEG